MTRLQGPVEKMSGRLVLRIPLDAGGEDLIAVCRGVGRVEGGELQIAIPAGLAEAMNITEGTVVVVDNENGKFNLFVSD